MKTGRLLRCGMIVACLSLAAAEARSGSAEELARQANTIQALLDEGKARDAEAAARAALTRAETDPGAESPQAANLSRLLGDALFEQHKFAEAEPRFRRALAIREALLGEHLETARSAGDLAATLKALERYGDAEKYYQRALAIRTILLGPDHEDVARSLYRLARLYDAEHDYARAASTIAEAIRAAAAALGANDRLPIVWSGERAAILHDGGKTDEAEPQYRQAIAMGAATLPVDDLDVANMRQGLANLLAQTGRGEEAAALYRSALHARERSLPADDPAIVASLRRLGETLMQLDRPQEAEAAFRRLLASMEGTKGAASAEVADVLRKLASLVSRQERDAEAELLYRRVLSISEAGPGEGDMLTALDMLALGVHYASQTRFAEAQALLTRSIALIDKIDPGSSSSVAAKTALAFLLHARRVYAEAAALMTEALAEEGALSGPTSVPAADLMTSLAFMRLRQGDAKQADRLARDARAIYADTPGRDRALIRTITVQGRAAMIDKRYGDAEALFAEALSRVRERHGDTAAEMGSPLADLGTAQFALGAYGEAARLFGEAVRISDATTAIDVATAFAGRSGEIEDDAIAHAAIYDHLVRALYRSREGQAQNAERAFQVAQRVAATRAAAALGQFAQRQAAGGGALAGLVRERQDLVDAWREEDRRLTQLMSQPSRDADAVAATQERLSGIDARLGKVDAALETGFPDFAELQKPNTLSFAEVQKELTDDEVLLFFADTSALAGSEAETFLWAIPKRGEPRWVRLTENTNTLSAQARALRSAIGAGPEVRGAKVLGAVPKTDTTGEVLTVAERLYLATVGTVADLVEGKPLVVVPSPRLAGMPFGMLIAKQPASEAVDRFRDAGWLIKDHAIAMLPAVSSIRIHSSARSGSAERTPYIGFGNPLLLGRNGDDRRAFERHGCQPAAAVAAVAESGAAGGIPDFFQGTTADIDKVRRLAPLPETVDEVCAIAISTQSADTALRLGPAATEAEAKRLSADGTLARARILHFATHGLMTGDLEGLSEPALVLTPPEQASATDDGLLTASEVTTLKLDADWVILSACNTAAGDGGGEALSGLARAFFYAGTRSLLVSHWPVNSDAAVRLVTSTVGQVAADPRMGRAEALRRAMIDEIARGGRHADPSNWAPFVLVGQTQAGS